VLSASTKETVKSAKEMLLVNNKLDHFLLLGEELCQEARDFLDDF